MLYPIPLIGYKVTFEFECNGKLKEETISSSKNFEIASTTDGLYLEGKRKGTLRVGNQGFYVSEGAGYMGIPFALYALFLIASIFFYISSKTFLYVTLFYLLFLFGGLFMLGRTKKNKNKR